MVVLALLPGSCATYAAALAQAHMGCPACQLTQPFIWCGAEVVRQSKVDSVTRARMDDNLTYFEDAMGSCERILRTPIPLSYTRCGADLACRPKRPPGYPPDRYDSGHSA